MIAFDSGFRRKLGKQSGYTNLLGPIDSTITGGSTGGSGTASSSSVMDSSGINAYNSNPSSSSPSTSTGISAGNYFDLSNYATAATTATSSSSSSSSATPTVNGHHSSDLYAAAALMASYSSSYPHRSHFPPANSNCSSTTSSVTTTTNSVTNARITDDLENGSHVHFPNNVHYTSGPSQSAYFPYGAPGTHTPPTTSFDPHNHFYGNPFAGFLDQKHTLLPPTLSCYDHHSSASNY